MLNKPSMPVPFNTVVDTGSSIDSYQFSCQLFNDNASEIDLFIGDDKYQLTNGQDYNIINKKLTMKLKKNTSYGNGKGGTNTFSDLQTPKSYIWKVRQIGSPNTDENVNIGYGFIEDNATWKVGVSTDSSKSESTTTSDYTQLRLLKVRPHTDMYVFTPDLSKIGKNYRTNIKNVSTPKTIASDRRTNKNTDISYWFNCNGYHLPILGYFYGYEDKESLPDPEWSSDTSAAAKKIPVITDDYSNPLFSYMIVGEDDNATLPIDAEYTITTNYIDSDEFAFRTKTQPVVHFSDFNTNIDAYMLNQDNDTINISDLGITAGYDKYCYNKFKFNVSTNTLVDNSGTEIAHEKLSNAVGDQQGYKIQNNYFYKTGACFDKIQWYYLNENWYGVRNTADGQNLCLIDSKGKILTTTEVKIDDDSYYCYDISNYALNGKGHTTYVHIANGNLRLVFNLFTVGTHYTYLDGLYIRILNNSDNSYLIVKQYSGGKDIRSEKASSPQHYNPYLGTSEYEFHLKETTKFERFNVLNPVANIMLNDNGYYVLYTYSRTNKEVYNLYDYYGEIINPYFIFNEFTSSNVSNKYYLIDNNFFKLKNQEGHDYSDYYLYSCQYDDKVWSLINATAQTYINNSSMVNLSMTYSQNESADIVNYRTQIFDTTTENVVSDSGVICDTEYKFFYDKLMKNQEYKILINISDSDGHEFNKYLRIKPNYNTVDFSTLNKKAEVYYLSKRNSVLIHLENKASGGTAVDHFEVYKTIGEFSKVHYVGSIPADGEQYFEDFIVGSLCDYTYYICGVTKMTGYEDLYQIKSIYETQYINDNSQQFNSQIVRIVDLIADAEDPLKFTVNTDNVWDMALNVRNDGFSHTIGKTYADTLSRFPVEVKGNSYYRSMTLEGMIGRMDCETWSYVDTYDNIINWERFINNGNLKAVIDLRGVVTIGSFDSNSFSYQETQNHEASVSVSFKQLMDENEVTILGNSTTYLPALSAILKDSENKVIADKNNNIIRVLMED